MSCSPVSHGSARYDSLLAVQYAAHASDALGWMATSDAAYSRLIELTDSARTLVFQGLGNPAGDDLWAHALADQVDATRLSMVSAANTTHAGRPVFGGTAAGVIAYSQAGNYVGERTTVARVIGEQVTVRVNQAGPKVFGPPGGDLFALLSYVATTLRANPSALSAHVVTALDGSLALLTTARAAERAAHHRVQAARDAIRRALQCQLSESDNADLAEMAIQVTSANASYQAALRTTAGVHQVSLHDFLR